VPLKLSLYPKILLLFFTLCFHTAGAQLCNGSLGDIAASIDFGGGAVPGSPINNVSSNYQHTNQDCPSEGFYALRGSTFTCNSGNWHTVAFDHTPNDPNGYFLLINALAGPSPIYTDTVYGLCPNITFQTDAWVINLLKPGACSGGGNDPNLTFTITNISGTVLAQYNSGDLAETDLPIWTSHSFRFTSPANGNVIVKITSNGFAGCGNEFAIDDITFRPCGPTINTSFANINGTQVSVCESNQQDILITANYNGGVQNPRIQWQISSNGGTGWSDIPGATSLNYLRTPTSTGDFYYRCTISDASQAGIPGCIFRSNFVRVFISSPPFIQATNYVFSCYGSTVYLFAAGGSRYEWWGPNGFYSNLQGPAIEKVNFSHTGVYTVKGYNDAGCFATDTTQLNIYAAPVATLTPASASICEGAGVQLNAGGSLRYKWFPSTGLSNDTIPNPIARPLNDVTYLVRVYNEYTCYDTASVKITVWKKPKAFAGPDLFFRKGKSVQLDGGVQGTDVTYSWTPPDYLDNPNILKPVATPPGTMIYTLTVVSNLGCGVSTDEVKVEAIDKLFIPTAFTPNGDGLNDKWQIVTFEDYENATVEVYNRFGQLIYKGYGKDYKPWDGKYRNKLCSPGTYVYVVNLRNNKPLLKGTFTLIR
jgi:gliding motility-associated-like protein